MEKGRENLSEDEEIVGGGVMSVSKHSNKSLAGENCRCMVGHYT